MITEKDLGLEQRTQNKLNKVTFVLLAVAVLVFSITYSIVKLVDYRHNSQVSKRVSDCPKYDDDCINYARSQYLPR